MKSSLEYPSISENDIKKNEIEGINLPLPSLRKQVTEA